MAEEQRTKAIILCAGKGKRLSPLTDEIPKPMVPIKEKPLLEYNINLCKKNEIEDIAINTSYLSEKIKDYFGDGKDFGVNINYSLEEELLGTAGALNSFRDFLEDDFVVIYGDNLTNVNLKEMVNYHKERDSLATIALRKKPKDYKTQSLVITDDKLNIRKFLEKPSNEEEEKFAGKYKLINSGIYILNPKVLDYIGSGFSDFAYDVFPSLIRKEEKVCGFMIDKFYFREIGKIEKYLKAKNEIESGEINMDN